MQSIENANNTKENNTKKKILVIVNKYNKEAVDASHLIFRYCDEHNIDYLSYGGWEINNMKSISAEESKQFSLAVVLGGDGTMLRTSYFIGGHNIPVLGINYGHLGFLTNSSDTGVEFLLEHALKDELERETRCHLLVRVLTGENYTEYIAMNEVCIKRTDSGRVVDLSVNINNEHVCDLRSDGIIGSTATGSTAYALAAGGPLVAPTYKGVIIVPLCPHTLNSRPLVTDANDTVEFDFDKDPKKEELSVFIDGVCMKINGPIDKVVTRADSIETTILRYNSETFYSRISKVFF